MGKRGKTRGKERGDTFQSILKIFLKQAAMKQIDLLLLLNWGQLPPFKASIILQVFMILEDAMVT